jgi:hypothetical protein
MMHASADDLSSIRLWRGWLDDQHLSRMNDTDRLNQEQRRMGKSINLPSPRVAALPFGVFSI